MAIAAWYGSEEEFTEYVRGPLRKELLAATGLDLPFSYALFTAISPFCMVLDIVVVAGLQLMLCLPSSSALGLA